MASRLAASIGTGQKISHPDNNLYSYGNELELFWDGGLVKNRGWTQKSQQFMESDSNGASRMNSAWFSAILR